MKLTVPPVSSGWCGGAEVGHTTASAHMNERFGIDYGVLLKENRLLGRAVFVIGKDGIVRHAEYHREISTEPDYESAVEAAGKAATES